MAIIATSTFTAPTIIGGQSSASVPSYSTMSLAAAGAKYAAIVQAPKAGTITKLHFMSASVTTSTSTDVRLETVSTATGDPTGTLVGTNTNGTLATVTANTWNVVTMTAGAVVTQGQLVALVVAPSGTPSYTINGFTVGSSGVRLPYNDLFNGTTWTKQTATVPVMALEYSDGTFSDIPEVVPIKAINTTAFNSGSAPNEYALKFQVTAPMRVCGFWLQGITAQDFTATLYDSTSTSLVSQTVTGLVHQGTTTGQQWIRFNSSITLTPNAVYRLGMLPANVTGITIYTFDVNTQPIFDQLSGNQTWILSTRTGTGTWTDTTTRRPWMGLIIDGMDDGTGGGTTNNIFIVNE